MICRATREALGGFESKAEAQDIRIDVLASRIEALEAQLAERDAPLLLRIVRGFLRILFGRGRCARSPDFLVLSLPGIVPNFRCFSMADRNAPLLHIVHGLRNLVISRSIVSRTSLLSPFFPGSHATDVQRC